MVTVGMAVLVGVVGGVGATLALAGAGISAAPAGASGKVTVVKATETDFHIALTKTKWTPGKYTFVAVNKSPLTHALEISGPGVSNARSKDISDGQSTKLTVTLKKGDYDIFCPIPGHKVLGMNVNIVVTLAASRGHGG
jgi:plastocyanin